MKYLKNYLLMICMALMLTNSAFTQEEKEDSDSGQEEKSLIDNGSFELAETDGMKKPENFDDHIENWFSATYVKADLFSESAKSELLRIPENAYGKQESIDGTNYAGFRAYTKDSKKQRTYIGRNLLKQMEKNKTYCIKAQVSLADLSKYAVNSIGVYVSKNKVQKGDSKSIIEPSFQIKNTLNPVINEREGWTTICGTYTANGGEGAIIIGCFDEDKNLQIEKLNKPKGFTATQSLDAYYYLENVEVNEIVAASQCECGNGGVEEEIIYSPSYVVFDELTDEEKISESTIYFAQESARINSVAKRDLKNLIAYLKENPSIKLKLTGHMDLSEFDESKVKVRLSDIGAQRAASLKNYFVSKGLEESRFTSKDKAASLPLSKHKTPMQLAKNRRVEFSVQ